MNVLDIFFSPHMRTRFSNVFQVYHKSEIKWEKPRARNQMNTKNSRMYERAYGKKKVPAENKKNEKKNSKKTTLFAYDKITLLHWQFFSVSVFSSIAFSIRLHRFSLWNICWLKGAHRDQTTRRSFGGNKMYFQTFSSVALYSSLSYGIHSLIG